MDFLIWLFQLPAYIFLLGFNVLFWGITIVWLGGKVKDYLERR